jgi:hypothetical protein
MSSRRASNSNDSQAFSKKSLSISPKTPQASENSKKIASFGKNL